MNQDQETMRRALGLAVQILEDAPDWLQPKSNMDDMRKILAGESSGRDGLIITEALATALFWRTQQAAAHPVDAVGFNNRLQEFRTLFELVKRLDPWTLAVKYSEACDRAARQGPA